MRDNAGIVLELIPSSLPPAYVVEVAISDNAGIVLELIPSSVPPDQRETAA